MELTIKIDKYAIDTHTDSSVGTPDVFVEGKAFNAPINSFTGFGSKISNLRKDRRNIEFKQTINATGEVVQWVSVYSNASTSNLFTLFKSMGIYMPKLTIGVNVTSNTIYTTSKLCRDLMKYSDSQRAAVVMYLLTLHNFIVSAENQCLETSFDSFSNTIKANLNHSQFCKLIRSFENDEMWFLKDSNADTYNSVIFYNTANISVNDTFLSGIVKIGIVKHKSAKYAGVATVTMGTKQYTFVISEKVAYTDFDLCNMEIAPDSVCAHVASAYPGIFSLQKTSKLPLSKDMEIVEFEPTEFEEFSKSEKLPNWLSQWLLNMISKAAPVLETSDLGYFNKVYSVTCETAGGTTAAVSPEDMRKSYDSDAYAQELYKQIKPYYEKYDMGEQLNANLNGFSNGVIYSMAFIGESGTGKSTAARVIPSRCGIPYVSINFSTNIEEADLFGSMMPNATKKNPEDPEFVWADGIITKAVRNGYCVILEEINFARPGVLGKLNSLLDENRQIDLSTGEVVRAHPNFRIIATCNIAYEGTNRFNKALINRFDDVTVFVDLQRNDALKVIKERTGYTNMVKMSKIYDVYEALKKFSKEQNVNAVVSMRQLLNIFTKGKYYSNAKDAVQRIMLNGAFIEDEEYAKVFTDTVLPAFDLKFKI